MTVTRNSFLFRNFPELLLGNTAARASANSASLMRECLLRFSHASTLWPDCGLVFSVAVEPSDDDFLNFLEGSYTNTWRKVGSIQDLTHLSCVEHVPITE